MALIKQEERLSIKRKCELLSMNRSGLYYEKKPVTGNDVVLMNEIHDIYGEWSFYGYRKIHAVLRRRGHKANRKKVQRIMQLIGLKAVWPGKKTTVRDHKQATYPYLLKDLVINRPNQVWQVDITYIKIKTGFVYLVCLIDVYSRRIMGWNILVFLDTPSCEQAWAMALTSGKPEIVNSDQGCQFTSESWCTMLAQHDIKISMDGKGRWADNVYIERLWRTIKYELIFLHRFETVTEVKNAIASYIDFYNTQRPHQALGYKVPDDVYKEFEHVTNNNMKFDFAIPFLGVNCDSQILSEKLS